MPLVPTDQSTPAGSSRVVVNLDIAKLKSLKLKRSQIKGQMTRARNYISEIDEQHVSIFELRQRKSKFEENWEQFDAVQREIEEMETEELQKHEEEREDFESRYFSIVSTFDEIIETKTTSVSGAASRNGRMEGNGMRDNINQISNEHLKLPRVNLPVFSGELEEWILFRNMFTSMIDKNPALPAVQKMQYLISSLEGKARDVVGSLDTSEENYVEAWKLLKERYDDPRLIVQKHIKALFELPVLGKQDCVALRQLLDGVLKHLRALKALERPTDHWDDLIIYMISIRLDHRTREAWEIASKNEKTPTFKEFAEFLSRHCRALEASAHFQPTNSNSQRTMARIKQNRVTNTYLSTSEDSCVYCGVKGHAIYKCDNYLRLHVKERFKEAKSRGLCLNCLRTTSHKAARCGSGSCRRCHKRHNTLLHEEHQTGTQKDEVTDKEKGATTVTNVSHALFSQNGQVMLATAVVDVLDARGNAKQYRALLDSGSQSCFITNSCAMALGLESRSTKVSVCGLGAMTTQANNYVQVTILSRFNNFRVKLDCLILDRISQQGSISGITWKDLQIPSGIQLADPGLCGVDDVDILLGAEIFFELMCIGRIRVSKSQPIWQKTVFGWIASGSCATTDKANHKIVCHLITNDQLNMNIARFWQVEHDERRIARSPEERQCERHFMETYERNSEGRFVVSLPVKSEDLKRLGNTREIAIQRFKNLERKLQRQPKLKDEYSKFIHEYLSLHHMKEVTPGDDAWNVEPQYYMPHHCVIKESSNTTKLRVVFNASSKGVNGI